VYYYAIHSGCHKKRAKKQVSSAELESLNAILRNDPALFERVSEIVELSQLPDSKIRKIDEIEGALIEKINQLGQQTLSSFGHAIECIQSIIMQSVSTRILNTAQSALLPKTQML